MDFIVVPLSIFLIFVAPLWLILQYRSRKQTNKGLSEKDQEHLQALINRTEQMQKRIKALEQILDNEAPQWREK
ncbi:MULTISPECIES: envelope stress response membrane protein PspB [Psychromonas]|uniref:envelope stress response membrane protein PspB n=1 Tax=Psychromonas TaxID=67572 RepID=UPI000368C0C3|nr:MULTISPECIES: envelope stress response membrane protein PspB [Psychromonas]